MSQSEFSGLARIPWRAPVFIIGGMLLLRIFFGVLCEQFELSWFDHGLKVRNKLGLAKPLDSRIQFFELNMSDTIAEKYAQNGEYATTAETLKMISDLGAKVIALDIHYSYGKEEDQQLLAKAIRELNKSGNTRIISPLIIDGELLKYSLPRASGSNLPVGVINMDVDPDNGWRRYSFTRTFAGKTYLSLALAAFSADRQPALRPKALPNEPGTLEWKTLTDSGEIKKHHATGDERLLNLQHSYYDDRYDKAAGFSRRIWNLKNLDELASKKQAFSPLEDAIVFYGWGTEFDSSPTAHGSQQPGMVLHGTALNDLLQNISLRRFPLWGDVLLLFASAAATTICIVRIKRKRWLIVAAFAGPFIIGMGGWITNWLLLWVPATVSISAIWSLSVFAEVARRWSSEQKKRIQRDAMLGFYFSPAILKQVTNNLDMIRPRGRDVAVMLTDLRGFTTLCETGDVERVFELLNRLFEVQTDASLHENGSLSRFAGDQFLAYWGAPEPGDDSADCALRAALKITRVLHARLAAADDGQLDSWLRIGIGLHYGWGLTGHVGSRQYRDYNLVGDVVNTTARIESQTKNYGFPLLASSEFIGALTTPPLSLIVDHVIVKGRHKPVKLHALAWKEETVAAPNEWLAYQAAFNAYEQGAFQKARGQFMALCVDDEQSPLLQTSRLLAERCQHLVNHPPMNWNGVFELTGK